MVRGSKRGGGEILRNRQGYGGPFLGNKAAGVQNGYTQTSTFPLFLWDNLYLWLGTDRAYSCVSIQIYSLQGIFNPVKPLEGKSKANFVIYYTGIIIQNF
jgi:hypothetical protein